MFDTVFTSLLVRHESCVSVPPHAGARKPLSLPTVSHFHPAADHVTHRPKRRTSTLLAVRNAHAGRVDVVGRILRRVLERLDEGHVRRRRGAGEQVGVVDTTAVPVAMYAGLPRAFHFKHLSF